MSEISRRKLSVALGLMVSALTLSTFCIAELSVASATAQGSQPTDLEDKRDWTVRPAARDEIVPKAAALYPPRPASGSTAA